MTAENTSFVPKLDARQRAMLAEMGVRVWAPRPAVAAQQAVAVAAVAVAAPATVSTTAPAATPAPSFARSAPLRAAEPAAPTAVAPAAVAPVPHIAGIDQMDWATLRATVSGCTACALCQGRKNTVFGMGDEQADWMIVGEAPSESEDRLGEPFVDAAGQLLDNMLRAVGRSRNGTGPQGAYITNVIKCRAPANRNPQPDEVARCEPYLARQVALLQPKVIVVMGRLAVQSLLKTNEPIGRLRGTVHRYEGVPVIVTYHPAYLLRTPGDKGKAWADLCLAMDTLESPSA